MFFGLLMLALFGAIVVVISEIIIRLIPFMGPWVVLIIPISVVAYFVGALIQKGIDNEL
jgi:hypothetical protein